MRSIDADDLERFIRDCVAATGADDDIATRVAESLVLANLRGHESHGVRRLPMYWDWSRNEGDAALPVEPEARPEMVKDAPAVAQVDGHSCYGQAVGRTATDALIERAEDSTVAAVGIRDASHLGRIGEWAERVAGADLLFGAFVGTQGGRLVAPPGSAQRRYSTSPLAFGVPTFDGLEFPVVLDMATSQVAHGKVRERIPDDEPLEAAWTIRADGSAVTDAAAFTREGEGALLPLGGRESGYKGFGLAMIAELFASIAGDGLVVSQSEESHGNVALFVAVDPLAFSTREAIAERVESLSRHIHETEFSPDVPAGTVASGDTALLPGEAEHEATLTRLENGIPLPDADAQALLELAEELGVTPAPATRTALGG
ncbi:MAG: Ldh family oxidoreductase [Salinirussus sp.]